MCTNICVCTSIAVHLLETSPMPVHALEAMDIGHLVPPVAFGREWSSSEFCFNITKPNLTHSEQRAWHRTCQVAKKHLPQTPQRPLTPLEKELGQAIMERDEYKRKLERMMAFVISIPERLHARDVRPRHHASIPDPINHGHNPHDAGQ